MNLLKRVQLLFIELIFKENDFDRKDNFMNDIENDFILTKSNFKMYIYKLLDNMTCYHFFDSRAKTFEFILGNFKLYEATLVANQQVEIALSESWNSYQYYVLEDIRSCATYLYKKKKVKKRISKPDLCKLILKRYNNLLLDNNSATEIICPILLVQRACKHTKDYFLN